MSESGLGMYQYGRFERVGAIPHCKDPNHGPPSMIVVPSGHIYRHKCPACGAEAIIKSQYDLVTSTQYPTTTHTFP